MAAAGLRVIRGPDWNQGEADGGEGHVGTIVAVKEDGAVEVTWDGGQKVTVKPGSRQLRVLDNAPVGIRHDGVVCDECQETNVAGMRWKCRECYDYDLCSVCYFEERHDPRHEFVRYETPDTEPVKVDKRSRSLKAGVLGIFPGATVVRGQDWKWSNQDGGPDKEGSVTEVLTPNRATVRVRWVSGNSNVYRLGASGKVDLMYKEQAQGGECYPQHLPVFDCKTYKKSSGGMQVVTSDSGISEGDRVYLDLSPDKVQQLRRSGSAIVQVLDRVGQVQGTVGSGEFIVGFGPRKFQVPHSLLKKVPQFRVGDRVRVLADEKKVAAFQDGHGGYIRDMRCALGKVGEVVKVDENDGDVTVQFQGGRKWCYNPICLLPAPGSSLDTVVVDNDHSDESDEESVSGLSSLNMLERLMGAMVVAAASQARQGMAIRLFLKAVIENDVSSVQQLLQRDSKLVEASEQGVGALHIAAHLGHVQITQLLVENGAPLNKRDKDGDTALIAGMKYDAVAEYLITKGSDVNVANDVGQTASHRAAAYGHARILRQLKAKGADFNATDKAGDTPLHDAIANGRTEAAGVLIGWPAIDLRRKNKKGFTPLQFTAFKGEASIADILVGKNRDLVNEQKEDGFTALHVAAINNHTDVMKVLIDKGKANVDIRAQNKQTPLHVATQEAYMDAVQLLIKHGADVNAKDVDGDRPLHVVMMSHTGGISGAEVMLLMMLGQTPKVKEEERVRIACFLLQAGADPEARNSNGKTALDVCSNATIVEAVKRFLAANPSLAKQSRPTSVAMARERSSKASDLCRKCLSRRGSILLVPCGHKAVCQICCAKLRACPQCGGIVRSMHDETGKQVQDKCSIM